MTSEGRKNMHVAVYGLGYVGLTLAASLTRSVKVTGVDVSPQVVQKLAHDGVSHIHETGITEALPNMSFSLFPVEADVHIICVGTPISGTLAALEEVTDGIAKVVRPGDLVVFRSTVPIGTTREMAKRLPDSVEVAYAPERTLAGRALRELEELPQVVAGSTKATFLFKKVTKGQIIRVPTFEEAEAVKLLDNCWRAWTFAFANQAAFDCSVLGLDFHRVREAAQKDYPRAAAMPASGFTGGTCLTKDPVLYAMALSGRGAHPFEMARSINRNVIFEWVNTLDLGGKGSSAFWNGELAVGVVGRTFKHDPETNDTRDSFSDWLDSYEIRHDVWDPLVKGVDWNALWRGKDVVVLAHPRRLGGMAALELMKRDGVVLDLWGLNEPSDRVKVFGA